MCQEGVGAPRDVRGSRHPNGAQLGVAAGRASGCLVRGAALRTCMVVPFCVKGSRGRNFMPLSRVWGCPARPHDMHVIDQTCTHDGFMHVDGF